MVPLVEVYDYGADPEQDYYDEDQELPVASRQSKHSLAVRTKKPKSKKSSYAQSGSDTETEPSARMSSRSSRPSSSGKKDAELLR